MPKTIWICWLQGWDAAPPLVRSCLSTWQKRNPGWEVRPLSRETISDHIDLDFPLDAYPPAAVTDRIRVLLLRDHGGVWVDSTLYCAAPLDSWLDAFLGQGFFAFDRPAPDRMLSSWFLAAAPDHLVTTAFADAMREYWRGRSEPDRYFWMHQLFADTHRDNPEFREVWQRMPKVSANGPHYFAPNYAKRLSSPLRPHVQRRLVSGAVPVYKLTHRIDGPPPPGSIHEFLLRWADEPWPPPPLPPAPRSVAARMAVERGVESLRWTQLDARRRLLLAQRHARRRLRAARH